MRTPLAPLPAGWIVEDWPDGPAISCGNSHVAATLPDPHGSVEIYHGGKCIQLPIDVLCYWLALVGPR